METYYRKQNRPAAGIRAYEDYREMLEKETDIQGIVNITPDHQHGSINISALRKGKAAISHKPVASVLHEVRRVVQAARESKAPSHLLAYSNNPDPTRRHGSARASSAPCAGGTDEPAVLAAGHAGCTRPGRSAAGIQLALWQGPEPERPFHPSYTFMIYRGVRVRHGMWRHGPLQPVATMRILNLGVPTFVEARPNNDAFVDAHNVSDGGHVSLAAFETSTVRWRHPAPPIGRRWTRSGATAG
jgi:hypothetical protein